MKTNEMPTYAEMIRNLTNQCIEQTSYKHRVCEELHIPRDSYLFDKNGTLVNRPLRVHWEPDLDDKIRMVVRHAADGGLLIDKVVDNLVALHEDPDLRALCDVFDIEKEMYEKGSLPHTMFYVDEEFTDHTNVDLPVNGAITKSIEQHAIKNIQEVEDCIWVEEATAFHRMPIRKEGGDV
jgi:hypothetical protein